MTGVVEMAVQGVGRLENGDLVAVLREREGPRTLAVGIGVHPAAIIQAHKEGRVPVRPPTHLLLTRVVEALGGTVLRATLDQGRASAVRAYLEVRTSRGVLEIGCAAEDAIAVASCADAAVWVSTDILQRADPAEGGRRDRRE